MPPAISSPLDSFWSLSSKDALQQLSCSDNGLSASTAEERLDTYGPNTLKGASHASAIMLFLSQFKSPITLLLIAAALLSIGLGDLTDALIILIIILISSFLGFWQEKGAAHAVKEWLMETVVPGDVVVLSAGDVIPGDSLLLDSRELFIDEAAFTGETFPVEKNAGIVAADTPLSGRSNTLFMGSHVISGKATALVVRTGRQTEFGRISDR